MNITKSISCFCEMEVVPRKTFLMGVMKSVSGTSRSGFSRAEVSAITRLAQGYHDSYFLKECHAIR